MVLTERLPVAMQWLSQIFPLQHYLIIIRGVMLKGVGLSELWPQTATLAGIGAVLLAVAIRRFKMRLD